MRNLYADFAGKLDSLLDTPEEARLIESTKSDEKKVKAEFEQFIARHNSSLALRFWLWLSAAVEAGRTVFGLLGAFRAEDANVISLQLYYSILSAIILVITLIGIIPSVLTKKDSEKYYKLMLFSVDAYMLIYLLRGVCFLMIDAQMGILNYSLIIAFFISGYTLYIRPGSSFLNTLLTFAAFLVFSMSMGMPEIFNKKILARIFVVAVLSCMTAAIRYRSKYKAFLNERNILAQKAELEKLNAELEKNEEKIELQNRKLQYISATDMLTGISNRRSFVNDSMLMINNLSESHNFLTIAAVDIDDFKKINDGFGHVAGDECLAKVAGEFRKIENDNISCYRFGGDEFVVLFNAMSKSEAFLVMQRLAKDVTNIKFNGFNAMITLSVGIYSEIPKPEQTTDHFVEKADALLYKAKNAGKNRIEY